MNNITEARASSLLVKPRPSLSSTCFNVSSSLSLLFFLDHALGRDSGPPPHHWLASEDEWEWNSGIWLIRPLARSAIQSGQLTISELNPI